MIKKNINIIKKNINIKNKKQIGGDGYSPNLDQPIGGNPGFIRYSNNSRPIFEGDLLDGTFNELLNGASNCTSNNNIIYNLSNGQISADSGYNILTGGNKKKSTKPLEKTTDCGCSKSNSIYDLIKLQGGGDGSESKKLTQFDAIREVAYNLSPLKTSDLTHLNVKLFNNIMLRKNEKKAIQFGGYANGLEEILAPLGKNNLLVLAALLLLHHFAVERRFQDKYEININKKLQLKGGNLFLTSIKNIFKENTTILDSLQEAFLKKSNRQLKTSDQKGGNPLRQLIEPLGSEAFLAAGLLIIIERFFTSKVNQMKKNDKDISKSGKSSKFKKTIQLKGGRINLYYEKLFNLLAPLTFNAFATNEFLDKISNSEK